MFKVEAATLTEYLAFDPARKPELDKPHACLRSKAPHLKRYFHKGTPEGEPGMRFRMIGYGRFHYMARDEKQVEWPVVGVALQKNYISVYLSVTKDGAPLIQSYA